MLTHLIRKEFLDSLLNQRFVALAIFSILLMPLSAFINYRYYEARKTSFDSQFSEFQLQEDERPAMRAYRPPALLSTVARGNEPYMPIYYEFSNATSGSQTDATSPGNIEAQDFSIRATFGTFDFLFIVQVVFSLLAILLSFDMIAGEKERGTLKAMLANQVPRDRVLAAKMIGGYGVLWVTFLTGFLLFFLTLVLSNPQFLAPSVLGRMAFMFALASLFIAVFFSIGLMVSAFFHSSRNAIVVLLVIWVVMQLVIPKAGEMIALVINPIRSEHEVRVERQKIMAEELATLEEKAGNLFTEITGIASAQDAFTLLRTDEPEVSAYISAYQGLYQEIKQRQMDRVRAVTRNWQQERNQQRVLGNAIALLSPASALTFLMADAAGTGDLAFQAYRDAVADQYQIVDREYFSKVESNNYRIGIGGAMLSGNFNDEAPSPESIPPFTVPQPAINSVITHNGWALGILSLYLILTFGVGYTRFLKYDAR